MNVEGHKNVALWIERGSGGGNSDSSSPRDIHGPLQNVWSEVVSRVETGGRAESVASTWTPRRSLD